MITKIGGFGATAERMKINDYSGFYEIGWSMVAGDRKREHVVELAARRTVV